MTGTLLLGSVLAQGVAIAATRASQGLRRIRWVLAAFAGMAMSVMLMSQAIARGLSPAVGYGAVSHHFAGLDDLLAATLRSGSEALIAAVGEVPRGSAPSWFAAELVRLFVDNRDRIVGSYELYALAARRPELREAVDLWLGLLHDLAAHHTDDPNRAHAFAVSVDGYFVQTLATGSVPRVAELEALLTTALNPPIAGPPRRGQR